ncbi:hypothetical protein P154DRAFT_569746 [Amniculicola lignicola CBS 123094]|uniref:Uncharacterized protein n=1 Tax=Amniculicola lignicola CBS 123094 TaxID=1392246 RepID=A0A6A5X2Z3_9PLEO|nr:hypothetical protein P154DRAFT_569746 [Amniculicola lignicola CBS 123094]
MSANDQRKVANPETKKKYINKPKGRKDGKKPENDDEEAVDSDFSVDSEEYVFVHGEEENRQSETGRSTIPQYQFPGTWQGALADTSVAASQVSRATGSYYNSIKSSGVAKAGWSIGGALANTANRSALSVAHFAMNTSGAGSSRLPRPVQTWMRGKEKIDEAKRRAEEAEKKRVERMRKMRMSERGQVSGSSSRLGSGHVRKTSKCESEMGSKQCTIKQEGDALEDIPVEMFRQTNEDAGLVLKKTRPLPAGPRPLPAGLRPLPPLPVRKIGGEYMVSEEYDESLVPAPLHPKSRASSTSTVARQSSTGFDETSVTGSFPGRPAPTKAIKTPGFAGGVFKDLDTPTDVRRQLEKPFMGEYGTQFRSPPFKQGPSSYDISPYSNSDDESESLNSGTSPFGLPDTPFRRRLTPTSSGSSGYQQLARLNAANMSSFPNAPTIGNFSSTGATRSRPAVQTGAAPETSSPQTGAAPKASYPFFAAGTKKGQKITDGLEDEMAEVGDGLTHISISKKAVEDEEEAVDTEEVVGLSNILEDDE